MFLESQLKTERTLKKVEENYLTHERIRNEGGHTRKETGIESAKLEETLEKNNQKVLFF